jgi:hypothetical protein
LGSSGHEKELANLIFPLSEMKMFWGRISPILLLFPARVAYYSSAAQRAYKRCHNYGSPKAFFLLL